MWLSRRRAAAAKQIVASKGGRAAGVAVVFYVFTNRDRRHENSSKSKSMAADKSVRATQANSRYTKETEVNAQASPLFSFFFYPKFRISRLVGVYPSFGELYFAHGFSDLAGKWPCGALDTISGRASARGLRGPYWERELLVKVRKADPSSSTSSFVRRSGSVGDCRRGSPGGDRRFPRWRRACLHGCR